MFEPCRDVNQECKTCRMGFWKAVLAKTSNLLKHLLGKFAFQPVAFHSVQQFMAELVDHPGPSPRSHRSPKLIGFPGVKPAAMTASCMHCS